jgi:putative MFS transporter
LGVVLILLLSVLGYIYSLQRTEWRIVLIGGILIFILYIYNSFSSAVYAPELWPTETKMRGSGISNAIGRIVAICMPYLIAWLLTDFGVTAVFLVLGILLSLCALVLSVFGIETRGKSVEEIAIERENSIDSFENDLIEEVN